MNLNEDRYNYIRRSIVKKNTDVKYVEMVMGTMSPQREWIRENMKPKTSPKTLEIQEAKYVRSKAFLFWDSYNKGNYQLIPKGDLNENK